jgi:hypothetical protein
MSKTHAAGPLSSGSDMNSPANPQAKRHIGQILIDQGILTEDQLRIALLEQTKSHVPVGRLLVQLGFAQSPLWRQIVADVFDLVVLGVTQGQVQRA